MGSWLRRSLFVAICAVTGITVSLPVSAQVTLPYGPGGFTSTASSGHTPSFSNNGANTVTITFYTGGGATFTVQGAGDNVTNGTYNTITNGGNQCGTSGVITAPANNTTYYCNVAGFPLGWRLSWTGNTGTIFLQAAISNAISSLQHSGEFATPIPCPLNVTSSYTCQNTPGPIPTGAGALPSPQAGYPATEGHLLGHPNGSPSPLPQGIVIPTNNSACSGFGRTGYVSWGTDDLDQVIGTAISGVAMRIGCDALVAGQNTADIFDLDISGNLAFKGALYPGAVALRTPPIAINLQALTGIGFPNSSSNDNPCMMQDSNDNKGIIVIHTASSGGGICSFEMKDLAASTGLCTDANKVITTTGCSSGSTGINLQASFPGTQQTGNGNISGVFAAGSTIAANYGASGSGGFSAYDGGSTNLVGFVYATFVDGSAGTHKASAFLSSSNESNILLNQGSTNYIWDTGNLVIDSPSHSVEVHGNDGNTSGLYIGDGGTSNFSQFKIGAASGITTIAPNKGQASCTLSALSCSVTKTVSSGNICTASYDDISTTVTLALLLPLAVDVTGTTLTIKMQGSGAATGTAAADYWCA